MELAPLILLQSPSPEEIFCIQMLKNMIRPPVRLQRQATGVVNRVRPSQPVDNTHCPLCWQHLWNRRRTSIFIAVTTLLFVTAFDRKQDYGTSVTAVGRHR